MNFKLALVLLTAVPAAVYGQAIGTNTNEEHQPITWSDCSSGSCTQQQGSVTIDSNWRWTHDIGGYTNCYTGNTWDPTLCPDSATCTGNCAIDGVDTATWTGTYGVNVAGDEMNIQFLTVGPYSTNVGSRSYLLDSSGDNYQMFYLKNREFTFTVNVNELECGLNGALYFVEMVADGGLSEYPTNTAGASYGTGYCDAQCPHDMKWIDGEANCDEWEPSDNDENSGTGKYGTCCVEMDIWEANRWSQAYTTHPCTTTGQQRCEGTECGDNETDERYDGVCDKDGCDFASYRLGDTTYYGPGSEYAIDTTQELTVVTQFLTSDGTDNGDLVEIRRLYVQNGQVIQNSQNTWEGVEAYDSITDGFCSDIKNLFGDVDDHAAKGGLRAMGNSMNNGMVLTLSMWDDHSAAMLWLDSVYPTDADPSAPGVTRGPCPPDSGDPVDVETQFADSHVIFSDIRFGAIDSTYESLLKK